MSITTFLQEKDRENQKVEEKEEVCSLETQQFPFCRAAAQTNVAVKWCDV